MCRISKFREHFFSSINYSFLVNNNENKCYILKYWKYICMLAKISETNAQIVPNAMREKWFSLLLNKIDSWFFYNDFLLQSASNLPFTWSVGLSVITYFIKVSWFHDLFYILFFMTAVLISFNFLCFATYECCEPCLKSSFFH